MLVMGGGAVGRGGSNLAGSVFEEMEASVVVPSGGRALEVAMREDIEGGDPLGEKMRRTKTGLD